MRFLRRNSVRSAPRDGYIIFAVLVVVVVLSLAAYRFSDYMLGEFRASTRIQQAAEAKALADSGIYYATGLIADPNAFQTVLSSNQYDNPQVFLQQMLTTAADGKRQGRFTLPALDYSTLDNNGQPLLRYGVTDEAGKLNLNAFFQLDKTSANAPMTGTGTGGTGGTTSTTTTSTNNSGATTTPGQGTLLFNALMNFPNMTPDIANAIVDWIDPDENPRDGGAESQYYMALSPPYRCKNGPLDSVEELLLVKGVTPALLFGTDINRNGLDDEGSGAFDPGWLPYLTVHSRETNLANDGTSRLYLGSSDLKTLYSNLTGQAGLSNDLAAYLIAYQLYMPLAAPPMGKVTTGNSAGLTAVVEKALSASTAPTAKQKITSLYSLIGSSVQVPSTTPNQPAIVYPFPLANLGDIKTQFPALLDKLTTSSKTAFPGRINVNTASQTVLMAIPGFDINDVQTIMSTRPTLDQLGAADPIFQTTAWLYTEANITPKKLQNAETFITARSQTYRVQSVGYFDQAGPMVRVEAVIDTTANQPRIIYYRDISELGRAFDFTQQ